MMKRVLATALFLLFGSLAVQGACSGSGNSWSCTASSTLAQINAAISSAPDGATLTLEAGTYAIPSLGGGAAIQFKPTKGLTIICATPPNAVGAATVNPCVMHGLGPTFGSDTFSGINTKFYRISGFTFDLEGSKSTVGTIYWDSYNGGSNSATLTKIRVDHNTFRNGATGAQTTLIGSNGQYMEVYGVYDHNLYTNATQFAMVIWIGDANPNSPPSQLGTSNNLFFEDNVLSFASVGNASAEGCTDGWGGSAYVLRHNTATNCLWAAHGVTHSGGPANYEFYNNSTTMNAGSVSASTQDCYRCFHHQGSGTIIAFNNTFTAYSGKSNEVISVLHYRDYPKGIDGGMPADAAQCNGTVNGPSDAPVVKDVNRAPTSTNFGYPCWHQPGRDFRGNYKPMYAWNNYWSDTRAQIPLVAPDAGGSPDYYSSHMQNNREWFNAVSPSANSNPSFPFAGTTGMGFGTLANQPTTCTTSTEAGAGVGYFATDQGPQGTLYTCSATNTWTVYYTPYVYPHPLVTGNIATVAEPTSLTAVVQ